MSTARPAAIHSSRYPLLGLALSLAACGPAPTPAPAVQPGVYALALDATHEHCNLVNTTLPELTMAPEGPISLTALLGCQSTSDDGSSGAYHLTGECHQAAGTAWRLPRSPAGDYFEGFEATMTAVETPNIPGVQPAWHIEWSWTTLRGGLGTAPDGSLEPGRCDGAVISAPPR